MEELSYRHLFRVNVAMLGNFRISSLTGALDSGDDYASSGFRGLVDFVQALIKIIEAQARGFAHGHGKIHSQPNGTQDILKCLEEVAQEIDALKQTSGAAQPTEDDVCAMVDAKMKSYNDRLIASASTRQYQHCLPDN